MKVSRAVLDAIAAHARREGPRECCGLLIGTSTEVTEAVPATNAAEDPFRKYEVAPVEHLAQIRRCRELAKRGDATVDIVGVYHSHPHGAPEPSPTDLEQAVDEFLYAIVGPVVAAGPLDIRGYRFRNGRFAVAELIVVELPGTTPPPAPAR